MNKDLYTADSLDLISVIARLGFIAKGIIYFSIGLLAFQIAIGIGGETSGATEILKQTLYQPLGTVLLILCTVGLLAHAAWKIINGFLDEEEMGSNFSGLLFRAVEIIVGFIYLSLCYAAFQILMGKGAQSSDQSTQVWISKILTLPYGKWIVFGIAATIAILGFYQLYTVWTASFDYSFDFQKMSSKEQKGLRQLGRIGMIAWAIVYFMIAFLMYQAAITANPDQAGGLGDALSTLAEQPYGVWILGITSGGLLIYGVYLLILSYYHQVYG